MLAAVTGARPKSPQIEIQWVWIRPLVERPQTKKLPNRIQKTGLPETLISVLIGEIRVVSSL